MHKEGSTWQTCGLIMFWLLCLFPAILLFDVCYVPFFACLCFIFSCEHAIVFVIHYLKIKAWLLSVGQCFFVFQTY